MRGQRHLFSVEQLEGTPIARPAGDCIDQQNIRIDNYEFNADYLLNAAGEEVVEERLVSHLLKSNCLITHQPDWGSVQISYRGGKIDREALLRYLVSFRHHNEFHEQCVERIFNDLIRYCRPQSLTVYARYTAAAARISTRGAATSRSPRARPRRANKCETLLNN